MHIEKQIEITRQQILERLKNAGIVDPESYVEDEEHSPLFDVDDNQERHQYDRGTLFGLKLAKELSPESTDVSKIVERMKNGIVQFEFTKAGGEVRRAFGTLHENLLPPRKESDKEGTDNVKKNTSNCVYFDMEKQAWRSFSIASLRKVF